MKFDLSNHRGVLIMPMLVSTSLAVPPTSLSYLGAVLKEHNVQYKIIDMRLGYSVINITTIIQVYKPTFVGISCWSIGRSIINNLIESIKEITYVPVVLGGAHVSSVRSQCLEENNADYAIKGEGEFVLIELLQYLNGNIPKLNSIRGLLYRANGKIIENSDREPIDDLDSLPFPAYEDCERDRYREKRVLMTTSRGCPYGCNYCAVKLIMGRSFRTRSPGNVIDEFIHWYELGYRIFDIADDCFTFDLKRSEEICDLIIKNNLEIVINLDTGIRADRVNESLLIKLKQAGCKTIMFGVESGDNRVLKTIGKNLKIEQAEKAVHLAKKVGIQRVGATFIIGHPGETLNTFKRYLSKIKKWPLDKVSFYMLVPYPGTKLFDWVERNSFLFDEVEKYLDTHTIISDCPVFETKEYPRGDRVKAFKLGKKMSDRLHTRNMNKLYIKKYGFIIGFIAGKLITHNKYLLFLPLRINKFLKTVSNEYENI
jgi:radical SAM superfamily enzyme YgiQ (UPF0313 family)|tara:strand:+ start:1030 stop:2481 length:1452 start_codon:yes stop_codon:yes gene_type:complete